MKRKKHLNGFVAATGKDIKGIDFSCKQPQYTTLIFALRFFLVKRDWQKQVGRHTPGFKSPAATIGQNKILKGDD